MQKRTAVPHDEADRKTKRNGKAAKERRRLVVVWNGKSMISFKHVGRVRAVDWY